MPLLGWLALGTLLLWCVKLTRDLHDLRVLVGYLLAHDEETTALLEEEERYGDID